MFAFTFLLVILTPVLDSYYGSRDAVDVDTRRWPKATGLEFAFEELKTCGRQHQEPTGRGGGRLMQLNVSKKAAHICVRNCVGGFEA